MKYIIGDQARIIRFMDGDTVQIDLTCSHCEVTSRKRLRLQGIESWEPKGPQRDIAHACAYTLNHLFGDKVGKYIPSGSRADNYGRLLGDIEIEGILLSEMIVSRQLAWRGVGSAQPAWYDLTALMKGADYGNR